ncbi:MAG TPA: hypothetical protein VI357_01710 [Mycobacteriales bacterium]
MRTALRRARRLGAFVLVTLAAGWVVLRRRSPVRWIEPDAGSAGSAAASAAGPGREIGGPGEVPEDVLATDAGLTELPGSDTRPGPSGTVVPDEVLVGDVLADAPAGTEVDEAAFEQALADATPAPTETEPADAAPAVPGDEELVGTDPATDTLAAPDPLTPAPFTPEPVIAESGPADAAATDALPEPVVMEPAGSDPLIPEPFEPEPVIPETPSSAPAAGTPTAGTPTADTPIAAESPVAGDADAATAVAEVVAAEPVEAVVAEEPGAGAQGDAPTDTELTAPELGLDEPTMSIARDAIAAENEETGTRIPMPTSSEAPTMEIPAVTDDLRAVRGIGPSMERMLHGLGIISFRQLAMLDGVELERVRAELSDFRTRIEREDWVGQARELHKKKYGRDPS